MNCISVHAQMGEYNAGKCIVLLYMLRWELLYMLRWESTMQVNELYYCTCSDGRVQCR